MVALLRPANCGRAAGARRAVRRRRPSPRPRRRRAASTPPWPGGAGRLRDRPVGLERRRPLRPGRPDVRVPGSRSPALDLDLLAYTDGAGINVIRWTTGEQIARVAGDVDQAAIDWPRIAYVRRTGAGRAPGDAQPGDRAPRHAVARRAAVDIGRPALRDGYVAWHRASGPRLSEVRAGPPRARRALEVISSSRRGLVVNPSALLGARPLGGADRPDLLLCACAGAGRPGPHARHAPRTVEHPVDHRPRAAHGLRHPLEPRHRPRPRDPPQLAAVGEPSASTD